MHGYLKRDNWHISNKPWCQPGTRELKKRNVNMRFIGKMFLLLTALVFKLVILHATSADEFAQWLNDPPTSDNSDDFSPIVCQQLDCFKCCGDFVVPNIYVCSHGAVCDAKTGQEINPDENHLIHLDDLNRKFKQTGKFKTATRPGFIGKLLQENLPVMIEDFLSKYYQSLPKANPQPVVRNEPQMQQHSKQEPTIILHQPPPPSEQNVAHGTWYLAPPVPSPQPYQYVMAPTYAKPMKPYRQTIVVYGGDQPPRRKYYISAYSPRLSQNRPYFGVTFIG